MISGGDMRVIFGVALVLSLIGCAAPAVPQYGTTGNYAYAAKARTSLEEAKAERDARKRQLSEAKLQHEIDRLAKELRELEAQVSILESQVADAERKHQAAVPASSSSLGCHTGPRGGRYTISKSGKKNYGGC